MALKSSVVLPFLNPHKNPINICMWGKWTSFNGQILDLHLAECIQPSVTRALISFIS